MTPDTVFAAVEGCTMPRAVEYADGLTTAMNVYDISTPQRQAAFLAQVGHESEGLKYTTELWGPTATQAGYEGRIALGNTEIGDGFRYRGRGLIMVTGRANYRELTARLRTKFGSSVPDFEAQPDELASPKWAVISAAEYWNRRGCNGLADAGLFDRITQTINGGMNGAFARRQRYTIAEKALTTEEA